MFKNISFVSKDNMCTGCGVCDGVCPFDAIVMNKDEHKGVYQADVDFNKCTDCTICLRSCPPLTWSNKQKTDKYHSMVGDFISCYAVYSKNDNIRYQSASGGFITTLLIYLLESKIINGAVVVKRNNVDPLTSEPFIATTKEEILKAKGSKYSPVKFNNILKEIKKSSLSSLAVVGLPCHIEGLSAYMNRNSKIRKKIAFRIGIVCGQSPSFLSYEYSFNKLNIKKDEKVIDIKNRGYGWPGYMQVKTDKKNIKIPYGSKYSMGMVLSSPLFTPLACQMCADPVGFDADISVSDAWLDKYSNDKNGVNLILTKTIKAEEVIQDIYNKNYIELEKEDIGSFIQANKSVMHNKIKFNKYRLDRFVGKNRKLYSSKMVYENKLSTKQKIKLSIFVLHLHIIKKLNIKKIVPLLNDKILFYFKALNLLKR